MAAILALGVIQQYDRIPRSIRLRVFKNFDIPEIEFIKNFRLTKDVALQLILELEPFLAPKTTRRNTISAETKVLCALRFFGSGADQLNIANDYHIPMCQQSASNCITQVVDVMNNVMLKKYIKFPFERREQQLIKQEFYDYCGISGVIGAVDCTHVSLLAPYDDGFHNERNYVNRKGWHSLNVQIVCDMNLRILNVVSRFPGCSHDAYIWKSCNLRRCFRAGGYIHGDGWLLGDSGYPSEQWLHTPFPNPANQQERDYNRAHAKGRCVVERVNGVLKSRFRCLTKFRVLNYAPEMAAKIINTCAVLHNLCINSQLSWEDMDLDEDDLDEDDLPFNQSAADDDDDAS